MSSLADLPELVGFFSYSRSDDEHSGGALSQLRARIYSELRLQLGGDNLRLWQDAVAIPKGAAWEEEIKRAIAESAFFIPIVTPSAISSEHCRFEFQSFLKREAELGRTNLIFPMLYVRVPALQQDAMWRNHDVLKIIGTRQYFDWQKFRQRSLTDPEVGSQIEQFCENIVDALRQPWVSPEERQRQEAEARHRREEDERRKQQEAEAQQRAEGAKRKAEEEAEARRRREEDERRKQQEAKAQQRAEGAKRKVDEEQRQQAEAERLANEEASLQAQADRALRDQANGGAKEPTLVSGPSQAIAIIPKGQVGRLAAAAVGVLVLLLISVLAWKSLFPTPQTTQKLESDAGSTTGAGPPSDEIGHFVSAVLASTEAEWSDIFAEAGKKYTPPKLVMFSGTTQSGCASAQTVMGPFYCPLDQRVYLDTSFFRDMQSRFRACNSDKACELSEAYVIAHEIGHHVQNLLGIIPKVQEAQRGMDRAEANSLQVRVELQADCLAGVWANRAQAKWQFIEPGNVESALQTASAIGDGRLQRQGQGYVVPDSFTHGTSAQRARWFLTGQKSGALSSCNTFNTTQL